MPCKKKSNKKIKVAVSGYFNPLHVGHLEMIERAKKIGDYLIVIINNDYQVKLKGSVPFMNQIGMPRGSVISSAAAFAADTSGVSAACLFTSVASR